MLYFETEGVGLADDTVQFMWMGRANSIASCCVAWFTATYV
jgi:hypothetical protein